MFNLNTEAHIIIKYNKTHIKNNGAQFHLGPSVFLLPLSWLHLFLNWWIRAERWDVLRMFDSPVWRWPRVPLCVKIGEVNVSWQETRVWRIWVHHIFISSISCGSGPAAVLVWQRQAWKGSSQKSCERDQQVLRSKHTSKLIHICAQSSYEGLHMNPSLSRTSISGPTALYTGCIELRH